MRHKKHGNTLCVAVLFAYPKNRRLELRLQRPHIVSGDQYSFSLETM